MLSYILVHRLHTRWNSATVQATSSSSARTAGGAREVWGKTRWQRLSQILDPQVGPARLSTNCWRYGQQPVTRCRAVPMSTCSWHGSLILADRLNLRESTQHLARTERRGTVGDVLWVGGDWAYLFL